MLGVLQNSFSLERPERSSVGRPHNATEIGKFVVSFIHTISVLNGDQGGFCIRHTVLAVSQGNAT